VFCPAVLLLQGHQKAFERAVEHKIIESLRPWRGCAKILQVNKPAIWPQSPDGNHSFLLFCRPNHALTF
jgi:hypothetical protein